MGLDTRSAIPHPRRSQVAPVSGSRYLLIPVYGTAIFDVTERCLVTPAAARKYRGFNDLRPGKCIHIKCDNIHIMRTNIEIDDDLMDEALRRSGAPTKRAAVEEGLRLLIQTRRQAGIRRLRGKVRWEGDLDEMRSGRPSK